MEKTTDGGERWVKQQESLTDGDSKYAACMPHVGKYK